MGRCCYGTCKNSVYKIKNKGLKGVAMIRFPKPKHQLERCLKWIKCLGRKNFDISSITNNTFICSEHFVMGSGPSLEYPDPIPFDKHQGFSGSAEWSAMDTDRYLERPESKVALAAEMQAMEPVENVAWTVKVSVNPATTKLACCRPNTETSNSNHMPKTQKVNIYPMLVEAVVEIPAIQQSTRTSTTESMDTELHHIIEKAEIENTNTEPGSSEDTEAASTNSLPFPSPQEIMFTISTMNLDYWIFCPCVTPSGKGVMISKLNPKQLCLSIVLIIDADMTVSLTVRKISLHPNHPLATSIPTKITSLSLLKDLVTNLDSWKPCKGANCSDLEVILLNTGKDKCSSVDCSGSLYSNNCLLLTQFEKCSACTELRYKLKAKDSRLKRKNKSCLHSKLNKCRRENHNLTKKLGRLREKLLKNIDKKGKAVSPNESQFLPAVLSHIKEDSQS